MIAGAHMGDAFHTFRKSRAVYRVTLYYGVPVLPPRALHPWHDIPTGPNPPEIVTAVIEIPTNERNKYELDKRLGMFRLDRVLHSAVHYPGDYGFLPRTLGDDGDPLDVLVLMKIPVFTGCLVDARPIGLFHLVDHGVADEKVLAVPMRDPYSDGLDDIDDIPQHYLKEIEHFFQVYKDLEGSYTETRGFEGAAAARDAILRAIEAYEEKFGGQRP
jgi:inorganic pyrophosphatase